GAVEAHGRRVDRRPKGAVDDRRVARPAGQRNTLGADFVDLAQRLRGEVGVPYLEGTGRRLKDVAEHERAGQHVDPLVEVALERAENGTSPVRDEERRAGVGVGAIARGGRNDVRLGGWAAVREEGERVEIAADSGLAGQNPG